MDARRSKGEGTSFHEGGLFYFTSENGSKLGTYLLIDANETEVGKKSKIFNSVPHG
jgi:hypothetical protein